MKVKLVVLAVTMFSVLSGCNVAKDLGGAYNMVQCKYDFNSVSNFRLAGMDLSKGISAVNILQLTSLLTGNMSSIPVNFTLNLDVSNQNQSAALLHGLQYILSIDNIEFTTCMLNQSMNIPGGSKQVLPVALGFDIATLLKGESKDTVVNIIKNITGAGNKQSNINLQIKPTFMIGGYPVVSPVYIPVNFALGGKK
jgi:LEA14-like dessication related protein